MKYKAVLLALLFVLTLDNFVHCQKSSRPNFCRVKHGDLVFTGIASFKFVIYSDSTVLWSNDGSSVYGEEPQSQVEIKVENGVFSTVLGESPMKPFFCQLLDIYSQAHLRIWCNKGYGFSVLQDQELVPGMIGELKSASGNETDGHQTVVCNALTVKEGLEPGGNEKDDDESEAMFPEEMQKERMKKQADIHGNIPMDALIKAKMHKDRMPAVPSDDAGLWEWEWLGPGDIGGRIRTIAINPVNPNIIFIGSVSGGIWKSVNGGSSWSAINDFLPSLSISSIVYDLTNLNIMYAGTGESNTADGVPGMGVFKSTDGGNTWVSLASTVNNNFKYVNRLAHHPDSTGVLYAAAGSKILKSTDGGITWISKFSTGSQARDICINPNRVSRLVAGCNNHLYTSNDWGNTWTPQTTDVDGTTNKLPVNPGRCEVTFCKSAPDIIYVSMNRDTGEIWRSDDNGEIWTRKCNGYNYLKNQGNYNNSIWVDPLNSNFLVVGGIYNWRSTDGGSTLYQINVFAKYHNGGEANSAHADNHAIVSHPNYDGVNNKTVFFGNDGGIQKANDITTVDTTSGWTNLCNTTLGISQFYGGAAASDGSVIIGGTQDNDYLRYRPSGAWSGPGGWYQHSSGDGCMCAVDPNNADILYVSRPQLNLKKSIDGGDSYTWAINGLGDAKDSALFVAPFSMDPNNPNILIGGGAKIWQTTDGAANWHSIKDTIEQNPKCSAIDIAKGHSDIIWVAYENGNVEKTTNGTAAAPQWIRTDDNLMALPDRFVTDIAINPNDSNEVYITFGGYNNDNVWYTNDGGSSWSNRSGTAPYDLPALPVYSIRVHPTNGNWIYIGTGLGVFSSMDKGQTWSVDKKYADNEGPVNVEVDELFWQGSEYLIAATHGRGMYRAHPLTTIYVDKNAAAGGNGSISKPFNNVTEAVNKAGFGTNISIKSNNYNEPPIRFFKKGKVVATNGGVIIK